MAGVRVHHYKCDSRDSPAVPGRLSAVTLPSIIYFPERAEHATLHRGHGKRRQLDQRGASGTVSASGSTGTTGSPSSKAKSAAKGKLGKMGPPAGPYSGSAGCSRSQRKQSSGAQQRLAAPRAVGCRREELGVVDGYEELVGCARVVDWDAYFVDGNAYFVDGNVHFVDGRVHYVVYRQLLDGRGHARSRRVPRHAGERVVCCVQGAPDVKATGAHCELAGEDERQGAGGDHERELAGDGDGEGEAAPRKKLLPACRPRISRSRVIAKLASQRVASASSVASVASGSSAQRKSHGGGGRARSSAGAWEG
ncbi:hypothetical protein C8J57DRAFT_1586231 [Mycena rebaudengoi]|nr:hypothetical protein C8J57DRAFT_1586231 [Mycena rebaudengoi]